MTELVTAVFEAPSTAEAAIQDLEMARIPSVAIQRGVSATEMARPVLGTASPVLGTTSEAGIGPR
jgi:hypothetical protein